MAGLLDMFGVDSSSQTPEQQAAMQRGLLTMGLAMMGTKGNFSQAMSRGGLLGMQAYDEAQTQQRQQQLGNVQMQAQRLQLEQAQQAAERAKQLQGLRQQYSSSPAQQALAGGGGPTIANAQAMQGMRPKFDSEGYGNALMQIDPDAGHAFLNLIAKQDTATVYDSEGRQVTIDKRTGQPVMKGTPKPQELPSDVRSYEYAKQQGYGGTFEQWVLANKQAGAVSVNMGSPVQVKMPDGSIRFVQPASRPGAPAQVLTDPSTGAPLEPPPKPDTSKPIPETAVRSITENRSALSKIDEALKLLDANKNATGFKGYLPDAILQRSDPDGVKARAAIADLGSLKIHDRSGAAVSVGEMARLKPFIPAATDNAATVKEKLAQFRAEYSNILTDLQEAYSPENGYRANTLIGGGKSEPTASKPSALNAGPLSQAREAIARGAPRDAVIKRLRDAGIDPKGL
jgi:hypothetical protein